MKHRVVFVTGAGRGCGEAICKAFLDAGDLVCGVSRHAPDWGSEYGARFLSLKCDVSDEQSVTHAMQHCEEQLGIISILVNNAGISAACSIETDTLAHWSEEFSVNATGVFLCTRHIVQRLLLHAQSGCIINISSIAGRSAFAGLSAYSASKAAVIGFTRSLAAELGPKGITVNAVCPGAVDTDMYRDVLCRIAKERGQSLEQTSLHEAAQIPMNRFQTPEDVAAICLFLASEGAKNINGESINLDGGVLRC